MFDRGFIKSQARKQLRTNYWPALLVCLLTFFLWSAVQTTSRIPLSLFGFLSNFLPQYSTLQMILFPTLLGLLVQFFISGPIAVGQSYYFLQALEGKGQVKDILFAFKSRLYWKIAFAMFRYTLIILVAIVLPLVGILFLLQREMYLGFLLAAPFALATIFWSYRYRLFPYVLAEYPEESIRNIFALSLKCSRYADGKLLLLDISFIGWYLLGSLIFGVGAFFVRPYHEATLAHTYKHLQKSAQFYFTTGDWKKPAKTISLACLTLFIFLILALRPTDTFAASQPPVIVTTEDELQTAIQQGERYIEINDTLYLAFPIEITDKITITGNGMILADSQSPHFIIQETGLLTLQGNLTITKNHSEEHLTPDRGGGIIIFGGTFIMSDGKLFDIFPQFMDLGGEESETPGTVTVLEGGHFQMHGGTILESHGQGVLVKDSTFHMYGGSISSGERRGVVVMEAGFFHLHDGDISHNHNGGIWVEGGTFYMDGGIIHHNGNVSGSLLTAGGGVRLVRFQRGIFETIFIMRNGEITNNQANEGGGIGLGWTTFHMYGGSITNNNACYGGGGISIWFGEVNIHNGLIADNMVEFGGGGGIRNEEGLLRIFDGQIVGNESYAGGGIEVRDGLLEIHDGQISYNIANSWSGGGVHLSFSHMVMHGGQISDNSARSRGGGIDLFLSSFSMTGGLIQGNTAADGGGISTNHPQYLAIGADTIFQKNAADSAGNMGRAAGLEHFPNIRWQGEASIPGTHLFNNYDISYAGRWAPSSWQLYLSMVVIVAIFMMVGAISFYKKQYLNKKKTSSAKIVAMLFLLLTSLSFGAIPIFAADDQLIVSSEEELREAIQDRRQQIVINDTIYLTESVEINMNITIGGNGTLVMTEEYRHFIVQERGVFTLQDNITLTLTNEPHRLGGGIYVNAGTLHMNGGEITGNKAIRPGFHFTNGGGIFVRNGYFFFNQGSIHHNSADYGGGISLMGASTLIIHEGQIHNNHAYINGGGIDSQRSRGLDSIRIIHMYGGSVRYNTAGFSGGGIYSFLTQMQLRGGEIHSNTAAGHGGVYASSFDSVISIGPNMRIHDNTPPNMHERAQWFSLSRFIFPDGYRFAIALLIAILGTRFTRKSRKSRNHKFRYSKF